MLPDTFTPNSAILLWRAHKFVSHPQKHLFNPKKSVNQFIGQQQKALGCSRALRQARHATHKPQSVFFSKSWELWLPIDPIHPLWELHLSSMALEFLQKLKGFSSNVPVAHLMFFSISGLNAHTENKDFCTVLASEYKMFWCHVRHTYKGEKVMTRH